MKINKSNNLTRVLSILLFCTMVLALAILPGGVSRAVDLSTQVTLTVNVSIEASELQDFAAAKTAVDVYRVANAVENGSGIALEPLPLYTSFALDLPVRSMEETDANYKRFELADDVFARALAQDTPVVTGAKLSEAIITDDAGSKLTPGMYLVVIRGADLEEYVTEVTYTEELESGVKNEYVYKATRAVTGKFEYRFMPQLVTLPLSTALADGTRYEFGVTMAEGETLGDFIYDLSMNVKPDRASREGGIDIVKTLLSYETSQPVYFVFRIDARLDGQLVYSDVISMQFTNAGIKRYHVSGLPVGAEVTVTEVYTGASYKLVSEESQKVTVRADEVMEAAFTNDYDNTNNGGGEVVNKFEFDENGGWSWDHEIAVVIGD